MLLVYKSILSLKTMVENCDVIIIKLLEIIKVGGNYIILLIIYTCTFSECKKKPVKK